MIPTLPDGLLKVFEAVGESGLSRAAHEWLARCAHRSKYVTIYSGGVADSKDEEFSQLLSPVKLGPTQLRTLWATIDGLFATPEGWTEAERDAWIQGQKASGSQREKVKSHNLESFIGNLNLKGLLDDVTICFDQALKRIGSEATRKRFLQINIPQTKVPEISLIGDPAWHSGSARTVQTFFENEKSRALSKRILLTVSGAVLGLGFGGLLALPAGWLLGAIIGVLFASFGILGLSALANFFIPNSRVYVDERSGKPGIVYEWGAQITTGIVSGLIVGALLWASGHL